MTSSDSRLEERERLLIDTYKKLAAMKEKGLQDEDELETIAETIELWGSIINCFEIDPEVHDEKQGRILKTIEKLFGILSDEEEELDMDWVKKAYFLLKLILCYCSRSQIYGKKKFRLLTVNLDEILEEVERVLDGKK